MMQLQLLAFTRLDATPQSNDPDPIYPEFNRVFKMLAKEVGKSLESLAQDMEEKEQQDQPQAQGDAEPKADQDQGDDVSLPEPEPEAQAGETR